MAVPLPLRVQRFRTQAQIEAERGQPSVRLLTVPTSDRAASRAFVDAVFGPMPKPRPVLPPIEEQAAKAAEIAAEMKAGTARWLEERAAARRLTPAEAAQVLRKLSWVEGR